MSDHGPAAKPRPRISSGLAGLDEILRGGLFKTGIYIVAGPPGSGKTILANQAGFACAAAGKRAVYITLLAETHAQMLSQVQSLAFFDETKVGSDILYLNGFSAVEGEGLSALLQLLRRAVRDHKAELLILDGLLTANAFARSNLDYKKFINELQTWVGLVGCTVLFLTTRTGDLSTQPEYTMVDGIFELDVRRVGMQVERQLHVRKFRGSGFTEGFHSYVITNAGVQVYPRFEAHHIGRPAARPRDERVSTGVRGLDRVLDGGLAAGSTTLILGSSGSGKTILGMQFLADGLARGEKTLCFGLFEPPGTFIHKGERLGLPFARAAKAGSFEMLWYVHCERLLDAMALDLMKAVDRLKPKRLLIDGLAGFKTIIHADRMAAFFMVLSEELTRREITTIVTEETRELYVTNIEVPTPGVSAIFHNILFVRHVETKGALTRMLGVMKTRDSAPERTLQEFAITDKGLVLGGKLKSSDPIVRGVNSVKSHRIGGTKRR